MAMQKGIKQHYINGEKKDLMENQKDTKKKQKKNYIEFKSCKNKWTKAELISLDRLNKATLKLLSGELIHRTTRTGFRWGVNKKVRKRGARNG